MIARHARATLRVRTETLGVGVGIKNKTSKKLKRIGIGKATELRKGRTRSKTAKWHFTSD